MESNTCYLSLPLVEAARVVSKVVEDVGMSSKMAACHELRWGDDLYGLVMIGRPGGPYPAVLGGDRRERRVPALR